MDDADGDIANKKRMFSFACKQCGESFGDLSSFEEHSVKVHQTHSVGIGISDLSVHIPNKLSELETEQSAKHSQNCKSDAETAPSRQMDTRTVSVKPSNSHVPGEDKFNAECDVYAAGLPMHSPKPPPSQRIAMPIAHPIRLARIVVSADSTPNMGLVRTFTSYTATTLSALALPRLVHTVADSGAVSFKSASRNEQQSSKQSGQSEQTAIEHGVKAFSSRLANNTPVKGVVSLNVQPRSTKQPMQTVRTDQREFSTASPPHTPTVISMAKRTNSRRRTRDSSSIDRGDVRRHPRRSYDRSHYRRRMRSRSRSRERDRSRAASPLGRFGCISGGP